MAKLSKNIDKQEEIFTDEELEEMAKRKFGKTWKILLIVFAVFCIGTFVYLTFFRTRDDELKHINLGTYKGLTFTAQDLVVTDKDVKDEINRLVKAKTTYSKLSDRDGTKVVSGDVVNCTYVATLDGEELESGTGNFEIGSDVFPDFEKAIVDKTVGDKCTVKAVIPEGYNDEKLLAAAGKEVEFVVTINHVNAKNEPKVDDEFAVAVSGGAIEKASELEGYIKNKLESEKEAKAQANVERELLGKVVAGSTFTELDEYAEEYYKSLHKTYEDIAKNYEMDLNDYVKEFYSMELSEFEGTLKESINDIVKEQLVLKAIAVKEKIEIKKGSAQYKKFMEQYLKEYQYDSEELFIENYGEKSIRESMIYDAAIEIIVSNAVQS